MARPAGFSVAMFTDWLYALPDRPGEIILHDQDYDQLAQRCAPGHYEKDDKGHYIAFNGRKIRRQAVTAERADFSLEPLFPRST